MFPQTPNLEVTPAERIHLSNLALMAYFQQALTKSTPTTRANFQSQIRHFLDDNAWFDDCLAVRMATETRQWDLLGHVARTRKAIILFNYEAMATNCVFLLQGY